MRERLGLNDSPSIQFLRFIGNAAQGKFGLSYRTSEPVGRMIERLPATLEPFVRPSLRCSWACPWASILGLYPKSIGRAG